MFANLFRSRRTQKTGPRSGPAAASLRVEHLETREMPAVVTVDVGQVVRLVDTQILGVNVDWWDSHLNTVKTQQMVQAAGLTMFRLPGGSSSDEFHFNAPPTYGGEGTAASMASFIASVGGAGLVTLDYGSGSPQEAAAFLAYLNATAGSSAAIGHGEEWSDSLHTWRDVNWQTAGYWAGLRAAAPLAQDDGLNFLRLRRPAPFGFHYFEVGNEVYGSWETDHHGQGGDTGRPHDPATYVAFAQQFATLAASINSTIAIGVDSGSIHYDNNWIANVLQRGVAQGFIPNFISDHSYMQAPGHESDSYLLLHTVSDPNNQDPNNPLDWALRASGYRTLLQQVLGSAANRVELLATEYNSVYANPGKQTTSLVNGLFVVDSIASLLQTEYHGADFWDLRNSWDTSNNNSSGLYGWRRGGDYGLLGSDNGAPPSSGTYVPYPTYFAEQLLSNMLHTGDTVVRAVSDDSYLSVYSVLQQNGHLDLLVINKSRDNDLTGQFQFTGFQPNSHAQFWQYGKTQDTAQSQTTDGHSALASFTDTLVLNGSRFSYTFPAYSMTVLDLPQVNPVAIATLSVGGFPSATTAGMANSITVIAKDANGNVVTGYRGTVHFTSSDPQAALPGNYTFTSGDNGVHTFTATLKTAGSQSLTATDTATPAVSGTQAGITVTAAAASTLSVGGFPSPTTAGTAGAFTVTARDAYGNSATGYTGTVHFTSSDNQASLPADYAFTAGDNGVHTFSAVFKTAGNQSLTATDTQSSSITGTQSGIGITPAAADHFLVTPAVTTTVAGTPFDVTVTVQDLYNNTVTGYTSTVSFSSADPYGATLPSPYTFTASSGGDNGVHTFAVGADLFTVGTWDLTARDTSNPGLTGSATVLVTPAAPNHFVLTASVTTTVAGTPFDISVTVQDAYRNTVSGYTGTVSFSSADPYGASLPANYTFTGADNGSHTFAAGAILYAAGTWDVTATDNNRIPGSGQVTVTPAPAMQFRVVAPATAASSTPFDVTALALDPYGNVDTNYQGTIAFSTTDPDPAVVLPGNYSFSAGDAGMHTFAAAVTLITPGDQTITITDTAGFTGSATITVTAPGLPPGGGGAQSVGKPGATVGLATNGFSPGDATAVAAGGAERPDQVRRGASLTNGVGSREAVHWSERSSPRRSTRSGIDQAVDQFFASGYEPHSEMLGQD